MRGVRREVTLRAPLLWPFHSPGLRCAPQSQGREVLLSHLTGEESEAREGTSHSWEPRPDGAQGPCPSVLPAASQPGQAGRCFLWEAGVGKARAGPRRKGHWRGREESNSAGTVPAFPSAQPPRHPTLNVAVSGPTRGSAPLPRTPPCLTLPVSLSHSHFVTVSSSFCLHLVSVLSLSLSLMPPHLLRPYLCPPLSPVSQDSTKQRWRSSGPGHCGWGQGTVSAGKLGWAGTRVSGDDWPGRQGC